MVYLTVPKWIERLTQQVAATNVTWCEEENIKVQVITMTNRVYGGARYGYLTTPKIQNLLAVCDDMKNTPRKLTQILRQMWQCKYMDGNFAMHSKDTSKSSMKNRHKIAQSTRANSKVNSSQTAVAMINLQASFLSIFFFTLFDFSTLFLYFLTTATVTVKKIQKHNVVQRNLLSSLWAIK